MVSGVECNAWGLVWSMKIRDIYIDKLRQCTDKHCLWQSQPIVKTEALERVQERPRQDKSLQMPMHAVEINKTACVQAFAGAKGEVATQL